MAERKVLISKGVPANKSFNPHHTGEWLKVEKMVSKLPFITEFQSSSYWRMAERK